MKKRLFALALAGVLAAVTLTGCGSLKGDETVATVDDTKIDADRPISSQDIHRQHMRHIILLIWEKISGIQMLLTERHTKNL